MRGLRSIMALGLKNSTSLFQTFASSVAADGGTVESVSGTQFDNAPALTKNQANSTLFFPGAYKTGFIYGMDPMTGAASARAFSRAGSAYRTNAAGALELVAANVPRVDYDPVSLAVKGYLIENAATNLVLQSSSIDNAAWTKAAATVTANNVAAPDGTMTADRIDITSGGYGVDQLWTGTVAAGAKYTVSVWIRAAAATTIAIGFNGRTASGNAKGSIVNVTTTWQRFSYTITAVADTGLWAAIASCGLGGTSGTTISAARTVYVWGAQLEVGDIMTSHIPTTTATVTRPADAISVTATFASAVEYLDTTKKAYVYSGGIVKTFTNGSLTSSTTASVPSSFTFKAGHNLLVSLLPGVLSDANAVTLTQGGSGGGTGEPTGQGIIFSSLMEHTQSGWNTWEGGDWNGTEAAGSWSIVRTNERARGGSYSARFTLNDTDPWVANSFRAELTDWNGRLLTQNNVERWHGMSCFLPTSYITDPCEEMITQWHLQVVSNPCLALLTSNGNWVLMRYGQPHTNLGAYQTNVWTDWVFHIKWSTTSNNALLEVWKNGVLMITQTSANQPVDSSGEGPYHKIGIYKYGWKDGYPTTTSQRILYWDEIRTGNENASYIEVAPRS